MMCHRGKQLHRLAIVPPAPAEHFSVDGQLDQSADLLLGQPAADEAGQSSRIHSVEHSLERGIAGRIVPSLLLIWLAAHRAELTLRKLLAGIFKGAITAGSHQRADRRAGQDEALPMT